MELNHKKAISEIIDETNCYIIFNENEEDILSRIMDGVILNVSKIIDDRIPIIRQINKKTYTPELLFYRNRKKIGSLKGVRQVKEIVSYIDKMSLM